MSSPRLSIVVAGTGTDEARERLLAALRAQCGADGEVITGAATRSAADAWNDGAAAARGEILLFLRDDVEPAPTMVADHLRLQDERSDAVGVGAVAAVSRARGLADYLTRRGEEDLARIFADREDLPLQLACGATLSMRRVRFAAVGGFGRGLDWGAEAELAVRLTQGGVVAIRLPHATGRRTLPSARALTRAAYDAGRASVELYRRTPAIIRHLELGGFSAGTARSRLPRRMLLAARCPPAALRAIGVFVPRRLGEAGWYRFMLDYAYWRGVWRALPDGETRRRLAHGPVVLTYHALGGPGESRGNFIVPARAFARHLDWLRWAGFRIVGLEELLAERREHRLPPARSVAITFDDGYVDNHRLALPALRGRGLRGTFFVVTGQIGGSNAWDRDGELAGRPMMSRGELAEMLQGGMEIGAHTRSHPALSQVAADAAQAEIDGAGDDLERTLGARPSTFAYPFGLYNDATRRSVASAGFHGACCTRPGVNDPAVPDDLLRRLTVRGTDSPLRVVLSVWRGRGGRRVV